MTFENFALLTLIILDAGCWYEARKSSSFMKTYLDQKRAWYAQRNKTRENSPEKKQISADKV